MFDETSEPFVHVHQMSFIDGLTFDEERIAQKKLLEEK